MESMADVSQAILGVNQPGDVVDLGSVAVRAALLYVFGLLLIRLGKSRLMANATSLDVVVVIVLGSLLSRGINGSASVASTMTASAILIGCHWLSTRLTAHSHTLGGMTKGHAKLLVADGQVDDEALRSSHMSLEDLREGIRIAAGIEDLSLVHRAYKERNGQISVIRRQG